MLCLPITSNLVPSRTLNLGYKKSFSSIMAIRLPAHAFASNPLRTKKPGPEHPISSNSAIETLKKLVSGNALEPPSPDFKILPFRRGRPLATSSAPIASSGPCWHLGWIGFAICRDLLAKSGIALGEESLVYLGSESAVVYWAIDVSAVTGDLALKFGDERFSFVELRTLMVATDWADDRAMGELAIAGHAGCHGPLSALTQETVLVGSPSIMVWRGRSSLTSRRSCLDVLTSMSLVPVTPIGLAKATTMALQLSLTGHL